FEGADIFRRGVARGAADRSYGIQVARLAGLPSAAVERPRDVLHRRAQGETSAKPARIVDDLPLFAAAAQKIEPAKPQPPDRLAEELATVNPDEMTPREALEVLYRLKQISGK